MIPGNLAAPRTRTLLLGALVLLPAMATLAPLAGAYHPSVETASWGAPGSPQEASPGDVSRTLTVAVKNLDTTTWMSLRATLGETPGLNFRPGANVATTTAALKPGDLWTAQFTVDVDAQLAPNAILNLPVTIHFQDQGSNWQQEAQRTVSVQLTGRTLLGVTSGKDVLPAASRASLPIDIQNIGTGRAGDVTLTLSTPQGQGLVVTGRDNVWPLGNLSPSEKRTVDVEVITPAQAGPQTITATLTFVNAAGARVTETRTLAFRVAEPSASPMAVTLASNRLGSGRVGSILFELTNSGEAAEDVNVQFKLTNAASNAQLTPVNASDAQQIGRVAAGERKAIRVNLFASRSASDVYPFTFLVTWTDAAGFRSSQSFNFGLIVVGAVNIQAADLSASYDNRTGNVLLSGTLTNTGSAAARNLYVSLLPAGPLQATDALYLGDLDVNAPLPFVIPTTLAEGVDLGNLTQAPSGARGNATGFQGGPRGPGMGGPGNFTGGGPSRGGNFTGGPAGGPFPRTRTADGTPLFGQAAAAGAGGARIARLLLTWSDDYGESRALTLVETFRMRTPTATAPGAAASTNSRTLPVPALETGALALALAGTAGALALATRARDGRRGP